MPPPSEPTAGLHRSRSAARVLALLDHVATDGPVSLSAAAAATDLAPSTALRHLSLLGDHGYVIRDDRGAYTVGPSLVRIALAAFHSGPYAQLIEAARPHMEHLVAVTEETAYLAVRDGSEAVYIATVESPRAIRHVGWVGSSVPIEGTAVGEALTAAPSGVPTVHLNEGAVEVDVAAVTAPVATPDRVLGAISLLGPVDRLREARRATACEAVAQAAASTAASLRGEH